MQKEDETACSIEIDEGDVNGERSNDSHLEITLMNDKVVLELHTAYDARALVGPPPAVMTMAPLSARILGRALREVASEADLMAQLRKVSHS